MIAILGVAKLLGAIVFARPFGIDWKNGLMLGFAFTFYWSRVDTHRYRNTLDFAPFIALLILAVSYGF